MSAFAQEKVSDRVGYFDLPGQALQISLVEFGLQARVSVLADHRLLVGQRSSPVIGPLRVEKALEILLASTNLGYRYDSESNTFIIERAALVATSSLIPVVEVLPVATGAAVEEVLVRNTRYPFRYQTITNSQMLGDVPYFDSSRFINLMPSALIGDVRPRELGDLLKYASGITPGNGLSDSNDDLFIRGFQRNGLYVDGFRSSDVTGLKLIPANIEQAEILKGPSTLLFGQAEPGGIVNLVRKKPQAEQFVSAELGVGSYGRRYVNLDANTPILDDRLNMRVVMVDEVQDESAELSDIQRRFFAPSAALHISSDTRLWASYEYQKDSRVFNSHVKVIDYIDDTMEDVYLNQAVKSLRPDFTAESDFLSAGIDHYFSDEWKLSAQYFWRDETRLGVRASTNNLLKTEILYKRGSLGNDFILYAPANRIVIPVLITPTFPEWRYRIGQIRNLYDEQSFETSNNAKVRLDGTVELADMVHHVTLGGEWYRQDIFNRYDIETRNLFPGMIWTESQFNDSLVDIITYITRPNQPLGSIQIQEVRLLYDDVGLFVQDVVELTEKWVLTLGGRYSYLQGDHTDITQSLVTPLQTYTHFSTQMGLVYKPVEQHSFYINYSEALRANYHLDDIGSNRADPELSDQVELGVKSLWMDGRLLSSLGLFEINKYNVVDIDFTLSGTRESLSGVDQRVRGMDMDLTLQLDERLDLLMGFSWIDAQIVSGPWAGNRPILSAGETFSLFGHYKFSEFLALSLGVKQVGDRYGNDDNTYQLSSYQTVDTSLSGKKTVFNQEVSWQLGVMNLLDKDYEIAVDYGANQNFAEGRSLVGSLQVSW